MEIYPLAGEELGAGHWRVNSGFIWGEVRGGEGTCSYVVIWGDGEADDSNGRRYLLDVSDCERMEDLERELGHGDSFRGLKRGQTASRGSLAVRSIWLCLLMVEEIHSREAD